MSIKYRHVGSVIMDAQGLSHDNEKVDMMLAKKLINILILFMVFMTSLTVNALEVSNAWIREAPPSAKMMGGFMIISNPSDKDMVLIGANSKAFKNVMLHRTLEIDGVSKMVHQHMITIPAHGKLEFKPGDYHIMMPAPKKRLVAGDKLTITLKFKSGKTKDVEYTVRKGMKMDGHGNHGHQSH